VVLGFELRALYLQSRHSSAWATPPVQELIIDMYNIKMKHYGK
jgi:hypothetical protein